MPLKIIKSSDTIEVKTVKCMIYGQPGSGKTSTAFTAQDVILLDCDHGAYRSGFRKDSVEVNDWRDIATITDEDLAPYKTVVIDTVGRLLDYLASDIIRENPKMGYNGALTLQGYGQLKTRFASWMKHLSTLGKDIVMIAHDKEDKRGDDVAVRPDIQGSSYGEVFKIADAVGYLYIGSKGKTLDFNPTSVWEGKNVAGLEPILVPSFQVEPHFFAETLTTIKESMNRLGEEGKMIADMVAHEREEIEKASSATALNKCLERLEGLVDAAKMPVKQLIWNRAKGLKIPYDKDQEKFVPPAKEEEPEPENA